MRRGGTTSPAAVRVSMLLSAALDSTGAKTATNLPPTVTTRWPAARVERGPGRRSSLVPIADEPVGDEMAIVCAPAYTPRVAWLGVTRS